MQKAAVKRKQKEVKDLRDGHSAMLDRQEKIRQRREKNQHWQDLFENLNAVWHERVLDPALAILDGVLEAGGCTISPKASNSTEGQAKTIQHRGHRFSDGRQDHSTSAHKHYQNRSKQAAAEAIREVKQREAAIADAVEKRHKQVTRSRVRTNTVRSSEDTKQILLSSEKATELSPPHSGG